MNTKESSRKIVDVRVDLIELNPRNVNTYSDEKLVRLTESIREHGLIDPIAVVNLESDHSRYLMLDGEHRLKAHKNLGLEYIPCNILSDAKFADQDIFDLIAFHANNIKGKTDPTKFVPFFDRMLKKYGEESVQNVLGIIEANEFKKLTRGIKKDLKESGAPLEVVKAVEKAESKSKDINQFTKYLQKALEAQEGLVKTKAVIFVHGKNEHCVIEATEDNFNTVKSLIGAATEKNLDINEVLKKALLIAAQDIVSLG